jgi:hypothetical protein
MQRTNLLEKTMEIVSFIDEHGDKLYCIGPFREKAQASRAAAGLDRISANERPRPQGKITARCWAIFDLLQGKPRHELIAEASKQGINSGTAATQYQKWRKSKLELVAPKKQSAGDSRALSKGSASAAA